MRRAGSMGGPRVATCAAVIGLLGLAGLAPAAGGTSLPLRTFDLADLAPPAPGGSSAGANPVISADGTIVAFDAPGLGGRQVYSVNILTGARRLVSATADGQPGNGDSTAPSISADGAMIAFNSTAGNLVAGATGGTSNVYVRVGDASPRLVSVAGDQAPSGPSSEAAVSADGRFVAFTSAAANLVPNDTNGKPDVFVRDLTANTTTLVSSAPGGGPANGSASGASISSGGAFVSFDSTATNLGPSPGNGVANVYVRDVRSGVTDLVSVSSGGVPQNRSVAAPFRQVSSISTDGRYVAFDSDADNLVRGDTNRHTDVFLRDRQARSTHLVSANSAGFEGNNDSFAPTITGSGQAVAFESFSSNLARGGGPRENVFVRSLTTGTTAVIDVGATGNRPGAERIKQLLQRPVLSSTGFVAAFESAAPGLTTDPNPDPHVLIRLMDPPTGTLVSAPPRRTRSRRVRIKVSTDDPRATVFGCRIDGKTYFSCRAGSILLPAVRVGRHTIEVRAGGPGMLYDPLAIRATFRVVR